MNPPLTQHMARAASRIRREQLLRNLSLILLPMALLLATAWVALPEELSRTLGLLAAVVATFTAFIVIANHLRSTTETQSLARRIEAIYPELDARLLTLVEARTRRIDDSRFFLTRLEQQVAAHAERTGWRDIAPTSRLRRSLMACGSALVVIIAITLQSVRSVADVPAAAVQSEDGALSASLTDVEIHPGDIELERGSDLLVEARFQRARPTEVLLEHRRIDGPMESSPMKTAFDDPLFGARLGGIDAESEYRVAADGRRSEWYRIRVFDRPRIEQIDAEVIPPEYTGLAPSTMEDVRELVVVEGTRMTLRLRLNKAVQQCEGRFSDGSTQVWLPVADDDTSYAWHGTIQNATEIAWHLVDAAGHAAAEVPPLRISTISNRPPEIQIVFPARDVRASPLQELTVDVVSTDDFGLVEVGYSLALDAQPSQDIVLRRDVPGGEPVTATSLIALEDYGLRPGQLVAYHAYAVDRGPDGESRRHSGDLFFVEIRPFEEIYREMNQPPGSSNASASSQSSGNQIEKLIEGQREISLALWNAERDRALGVETASPAAAILRAQEQLRDQLPEAVDNLQPGTQGERALNAMNRVINDLAPATTTDNAEAVDESSPNYSRAHRSSLTAYQALLSLRADEHLITQGQQGSQGSSSRSSSAANSQMSSLELSKDRDRYETESSAQSANEQLDPASEALNELQTLAERQGLLNEEVRQFEAERRQPGQSPEERRRELERLRDMQRQLLHDVDSLSRRMAENNALRADEAEALENSRQNMNEAAKALESGQTGKAVSEGAKADRELSNAETALRSRAASQFAGEVAELADRAEAFHAEQERLAGRWNEENPTDSPSLRPTADPTRWSNDVRLQHRRLEQLARDARDLAADAEAAEPLLARDIRRALTEAEESQLDEILKALPLLERAGLSEQAQAGARQAESAAARIRERFRAAAESAAGNNVDMLKRARQELADLRDGLEQEVGNGNGKAEGEPSRAQGGEPGRGEASPDSPGGDNPGSSSEGSPQPAGNGEASGKPSEGASPIPGSPGGQGGGGQGGGQSGMTDGPDAEDSESAAGGLSGLARQLAEQTQGGANKGGSGAGGSGGPITGSDFTDWSRKLRGLEQALGNSELGGIASRVRQAARSMRADFKRHGQAPTDEEIRRTLLDPLDELDRRLQEQILLREDPDVLVPVDRDPVPQSFEDIVNEYYKRLSSGVSTTSP